MSFSLRSIRDGLVATWRAYPPQGGERVSVGIAFLAGVAMVFAFEPFGVAPAAWLALALLFWQWRRAAPRHAWRSGFAFGAGYFGAGVSWVYVALNTFGGMPALLAGLGTALFCAYCALFPAAVGWLATRWIPAGDLRRLAAAGTAWVVLEWVRSWAFSGFPWLGVGYATLNEHGPGALSGFAPVGGVWLASLALTAVAAVLAAFIDAMTDKRPRDLLLGAAVLLAVFAVGALLRLIPWTTPVGEPIDVSLVQGNVSQDQKFDPAMREKMFALYVDLVRASRGRVVVLPESALPAFVDEVPRPVLRALFDVAAERRGSVLTGVFTFEPPLPGEQALRYYNSVVAFGDVDVQLYRKRHLVPFGETIPLEPIVGWFIRSVLSIPLANQTRGNDDQAAFNIAGQRIAVNICYEDVFGPDIRPQAKRATLLVNVTNDAWYGHSIAARQHNQIASMRALETGRPLLRATNTGITSVIDERGRETARLPWFTRGILEVRVTGTDGTTPYVLWGDMPAIVLALALLAAALKDWRPRPLPDLLPPRDGGT